MTLETVVVERAFSDPVEYDVLANLERQHSGCFEMHRVTYLRTFLSLDGRRMLCIYQAPDAESVRIANQTAGLPFDRVYAVREFP